MSKPPNPTPKWLRDVDATSWATLAEALRRGMCVPNGFVVAAATPEEEIRSAYEELQIQEKTHFVAVRGSSHAMLNVIGPDTLIHTLRRLCLESPDAPILIQRMIHAAWSGKAERQRRSLRVRANEGMLLLDPDTYYLNEVTGKCVRKVIESKQRRMIRHVDGTAKTVERKGDRQIMSSYQLAAVANLIQRAEADISWAIDDQGRVWLIGVSPASNP